MRDLTFSKLINKYIVSDKAGCAARSALVPPPVDYEGLVPLRFW